MLSPASGTHNEYQDMAFKADEVITRTSVATIIDASAQTYTAAQVLGGIIVRDPAGAARIDVLPTAALLIGAMKAPKIGDTVRCLVVNGADQNEAITIAAGTGGDFAALQQATSKDIGQNTSRLLHIRVTAVAAGSEAYVIYM